MQLMRNSSGSVQPAATARSVLRVLCQNGEDQNNALAVTLSRVLVCKPHSADCEPLVSAYNLLKTNSRSSLERDTIADYLYVRINMPPLVEFDPRPAVLHWLTDKKRRVPPRNLNRGTIGIILSLLSFLASATSYATANCTCTILKPS